MDNRNIMPNNLLRGFERYKEEYEQAALAVLQSGWYILGKRVSEFENQFAAYCGAEHCVGLASGLDALWIGMKCAGIGSGDEVIVQANTYIASVMGITINNAIPIFVEPDEYYGLDPSKIEEKITEKTKAILVVHLYGIPCDMYKICDVARRHNLMVIEDCAQSHDATYKGKMTGTFGDVGCFSFYPSKNLGAFGDAGCIVTDSKDIAYKTSIFRNYGSQERYKNEIVGANSRLDEVQAALLSVKLEHLKELTEERRHISRRYEEGITNKRYILPEKRPKSRCV